MMIDTSTWKSFIISDLLTVSRGQRHVVSNHEKGDLPYYSASLDNNGVTDYISNPLFVDNDALVVTTFGDAFYAKGSFTASDEITILHHENMNELSGLFIASAIRQNKWKYSFKVKAFKERVSKDSISLPVTKNGQPDWAYMESYMKAVMEVSEKSLKNLKKAEDTIHPIDIRNWGDFAISDLFEVVKGKRLTKANMKDGSIRFVGSSAMNNGETHRIANDEHLHPANTITVCYNGSVGETFYQDEEFWASDDVNVLYPRFEMNRFIAFFICPIIKSVGQKYAFIDKWKQDNMKDEVIKLPITSSGKPNWQYMEDYMKSVTEESKNIIDCINSVV